ncbi:hypothetical protein A4S05_29970 [Nostoc sp. KVJ20]|nr:hypothetical protein A4S05_29970 [Nostoc sp. KVJ20]
MGSGYWVLGTGTRTKFFKDSVPNHQSPITSPQSPVPNHQSPITSPQSPAPRKLSNCYKRMTIVLIEIL